MNDRYMQSKILIIGLTVIAAAIQVAMAAPSASFTWSTVVNNGDVMPSSSKNFNSYNQPSVNTNRLVVFRARSKGGQGQPVHGVYTRDMASAGPIIKILDRNTLVPQPNNQNSVFIEPPSFPRIDIQSNTIATRGNHQPAWFDGEALGTTGIYTNPFGPLITGASKLGSVTDFSFFEVPEFPGTPFDVFPGSPAVTDGSTIVFKGNYTVNLVGKTGVYYRNLENVDINGRPGGGSNPAVLIANNTDTLIPGTSTVFGSTAPPSAAGRQAVFAGFDIEEAPTKGGIYLAPLTGPEPPLTTLVSIGSPVPGETNASFNQLGEGVSFDGRLVSFWGAWGDLTKIVRLYCPEEGNKDRIDYCNNKLEVPDPANPGQTKIIGDPNSTCDDPNDDLEYWDRCYQEKNVPVNQGVFVYDVKNRQSYRIARTGVDFTDFVYWVYSGRTPGVGESSEEGDDDGEPTRWRSSAFVAVSGLPGSAYFHNAFKARTGAIDPDTHVYVNPVDGIYLVRGPGQSQMQTVARSGMDGALIDPEAVGLPVTEMGIERDSLRGNSLVINASMGSEETGWAGIYLTRVPRP